MEPCKATNETINVGGTDVQTASGSKTDVTAVVETPTQKRVVKLTAKALAEKLDKLQTDRKAKLNKANFIRKSIRNYMVKNERTQVDNDLNELIDLCNEIKYIHESLLQLLPSDEKEKHVIWFKAKMLSNDECIANANVWMSCSNSQDGNVISTNAVSNTLMDVIIVEQLSVCDNVQNANLTDVSSDVHGGTVENVAMQNNGLNVDPIDIPSQTSSVSKMLTHNNVSSVVHKGVEDEVNPDDSISNVASNCSSRKSGMSKVSTTSSARIRAEAERAALIARAAVLKERHALEELEQQLRRRREQLDMETDLAASSAKLAVLQASDVKSCSRAPTDGMNSYLEKEKRKQQPVSILNPSAKEFNAEPWKSTQPINVTNQSLLPNDPPPLDVRRKETERWCMAASTQWYKSNEQQQTNMSTRPVPSNNPPLPDVQRKEMDRRCKAASRQWYVGEQQPLDLSKELPSSNDPPPLDMRRKEAEQWHEAISRQWCNPNEHWQENTGTSQQSRHQTLLAPLEGSQRQLAYHQPVGQYSSSDLFSIMQRQNDITAALVRQQHTSSLPPREIPIFEGDPLQYRAFIRAFEQGVEGKAGKADCLYYLEQFTRGRPQELVRSCQHMNPERGFSVAKELLQEHFGNPYKIAAAYMEKALAWEMIKSEDTKSLQTYCLFLRGCCNVMEELPYVQELDMPVKYENYPR